eukprot:5274589-Pleurochrysis_carterae.AAC.2
MGMRTTKDAGRSSEGRASGNCASEQREGGRAVQYRVFACSRSQERWLCFVYACNSGRGMSKCRGREGGGGRSPLPFRIVQRTLLFLPKQT